MGGDILDSREAATLLTKTAIEKGILDLDNTHYATQHEKAEIVNQHNAKQIGDFYTSLHEAIVNSRR